MIPSCLGNIAGGSFFVGFVYWYLHLAGNDEDSSLDQPAMHAHGDTASCWNTIRNPVAVVIGNGTESVLPNSGNVAQSRMAGELNHRLFKREVLNSAANSKTRTLNT